MPRKFRCEHRVLEVRPIDPNGKYYAASFVIYGARGIGIKHFNPDNQLPLRKSAAQAERDLERYAENHGYEEVF